MLAAPPYRIFPLTEDLKTIVANRKKEIILKKNLDLRYQISDAEGNRMRKLKIQVPISRQLADQIRSCIISGEFKAGEKLSARSISDAYEVSATPVKEAFKILATEGFVITTPRSGTYVSDVASSGIKTISYIRSSLEGVAVNLAANLATKEDLTELENILDKSDEYIEKENISGLVACNTEFHKMIRKIAGCQYLSTLIEELYSFDVSIRKRALDSFELRRAGGLEHRTILELMKDGQAEEAEKLMINHIRKTAETIIKHQSEEEQKNEDCQC